MSVIKHMIALLFKGANWPKLGSDNQWKSWLFGTWICWKLMSTMDTRTEKGSYGNVPTGGRRGQRTCAYPT